jgi:NAD(P)H-dependent flavin oxidoreductase YrpB (nitropropane dioxygenase family)
VRTLNTKKVQNYPEIIQGGMGIDVSGWRMARRVAELGEVGTISGICLDTVMVRELQLGDPENRIEALKQYPDQEIVDEIIDKYYVEGGIDEDVPFALLPIHGCDKPVWMQRVLSAAVFSEVYMAKQGHDGIIAMNLMAKLKRHVLAAFYGAMLAGVDWILMGAGIPIEEAEQLVNLARGDKAWLKLDVDTSEMETDKSFYYELDPADLVDNPIPMVKPAFFPIISSDGLARILDHRLPEGTIDGWIVERPVAGGHNAPPRNKQYDEIGDPVYDERDKANLKKIADLGYPFYLAGGYGTPKNLRKAQKQGAAGIQVGSVFALTKESNYPSETKKKLIREIYRGNVTVRTDGRVSPTGFPFKVVEMEGTLGIKKEMRQRRRICDLGYLRELYATDENQVRHRCPAEAPENYVAKGGSREATENRGCLCNALFANIGLPQRQPWGVEGKILTAGDDIIHLKLGSEEDPTYTVEDVINYLKQ